MDKINDEDIFFELPEKIPLIPLKNTVIFPAVVMPVVVGRQFSFNAVNISVEHKMKYLVLAPQKDPSIENPSVNQIYSVGVVCRIFKVTKLFDSSYKIIAEGLFCINIENLVIDKEYIVAKYTIIKHGFLANNNTHRAYMRTVLKLFKKYAEATNIVSPETVENIQSQTEIQNVFYLISSYMPFSIEEKIEILSSSEPEFIFNKLHKKLADEIEIILIEKNIENKVRQVISKAQKNVFLSEQLKVIKKELADEKLSDSESEAGVFKSRLKEISAIKEPHIKKIAKEIEKLDKIPHSSPEYAVIVNYLEILFDMPWDKSTDDNLDIEKAEKILNNDHYGLEKVKERIVEYLSVIKLSKKLHSSILCFVGPPGVGKTSLAASIARAMGREYVKISLGGMHDEAEIRGHRKTYIGAMPGQIIRKLKEVQVKNPVFLLDEIDKLGSDYRGDPSHALLEVLDPEQNHSFIDNYLEVPFDLSNVFFITTANSVSFIPPPLLDRMEIVEIPGYIFPEKFMIAKKYLVKKQLDKLGLTGIVKVEVADSALKEIIKKYVRESGVRKLEREINKICRKSAKIFFQNGETQKITVTKSNLKDFLGVEKYIAKDILKSDEVGIATAMAWTEYGGEILFIQTEVYASKSDKIILTGRLGEVMRESAAIALSFAKVFCQKHSTDKKSKNFFDSKEIHIHLPQGAVPKDGPSAGTALAVSLISLAMNVPVKRDVALTGEINLKGEVLPIGGLREKITAAISAGIKKVVVPVKNRKDITELPDYIKNEIEIVEVENLKEILKIILTKDIFR